MPRPVRGRRPLPATGGFKATLGGNVSGGAPGAAMSVGWGSGGCGNGGCGVGGCRSAPPAMSDLLSPDDSGRASCVCAGASADEGGGNVSEAEGGGCSDRGLSHSIH